MSSIIEEQAPAAEPANQPSPGADTLAKAGVRPDQAVEICMTAFRRAYDSRAARKESEFECQKAGRYAYRLAMPLTVTLDGVQGFIACVTHGIHIGVWNLREPNQLLYAAQVALAAHRRAAPKR